MTGLEKKREKKCLRNNLPENTKKVENEKQFESFARIEIKRSEVGTEISGMFRGGASLGSGSRA